MKDSRAGSMWKAPLWIGVSSAAGLVIALFDDGWLDVFATVLLAAPVAVLLALTLRRAR